MNSGKRVNWIEVLLWVVLIAAAPLSSAFVCEAVDTNESEVQAAVCNGYEAGKLADCMNWLSREIDSRDTASRDEYEGLRSDFEIYYKMTSYHPPPPPPEDDAPLLRTAASTAPLCPSILFRQPAVQFTSDFDSLGTTTYPLLLFRQTDGSFTVQGFTEINKIGTYVGARPQGQAFFASCGGNSWPTVSHPSILGVTPGTSTLPSLVTNLGGALPYAGILASGTTAGTVTVSLDSQTTLGQKQTDYPVGGSPVGFLAADFNGDGKRDIAVLNANSSGSGPGNVALLLGNGDGTLRAATNYPVGTNPTSMTWFDFNKDGRADLAVTNNDSHDVTVLLGNSDGTLHFVATYPVPGTFSDASNQIVSGDFDGDGNADLIVFSSHNFYLLHGNGDGTFTLKPQLAGYQSGYEPAFLVAGDFNKDGKLDLASVNYDATVTILLNGGGGSFANQNRYVVGTPFSMGSAFVPSAFAMDFNDDGNLDLVFATGHPDALYPVPMATTVLFGNGDGTFQGPPAFDLGYGPTSMASADFNRDGRPDLVITASDGTNNASMWIVAGRSGGGFQPPAAIPLGDTANWVTTADLNRDGFPDIVTVDSVAVRTYLGKGDGTFQAPVPTLISNRGTFVTAGDVNGDGLPDVLVSYGYPENSASEGLPVSASLFIAKAGGGFNAATTVATGINTLQTALADVNGDGHLDLIAVNLGYPRDDTPVAGNVTVSLGNGNGTFQTPVSYTVGVAPTSLAVADVNGDGHLDLIIGTLNTATSQIAVLLGAGNGTFGAATKFVTYSYPSNIIVADFNGDKIPDIAIVHWSGDSPATFMQGNGDGTFQPEGRVLTGDTPVAAVAGDFSATGKQDLAVLTNPSVGTGSVGLFQNLSAGGGSVTCTYTLSANPPQYSNAAATGSFTVTASAGCTWTAVSNNPDWLTVTGTSGSTVNYSLTQNTGVARTGTIMAGGQTFTVMQAAGASGSGVPSAVSSSPNSGNVGAQTYTFTFSDTAGYQAINIANVLINNFIDGRHSCYIAIAPSSASAAVVYLVDDAGDAGGPFTGLTLSLPGSGTIQNSQCGIAGSGSSISGSGNTLTVTLAMTFKSAFGGNRIIYMAARETVANSGWQAMGTAAVPGGTVTGPSVTGVNPPSMTGMGSAYTITFADTNGYTDLGVVDVLINDSLNGSGACYLAYSRSAAVLYLLNDTGTALGSGMVLNGSAASLSNSQCTVAAAGSSAGGSGNTLTLILSLTFSATFAGNRVIYVAARSNGDAQNSGWQPVGTVAVAPASGGGGGNGNITSIRMEVGNYNANATPPSFTNSFTWDTDNTKVDFLGVTNSGSYANPLLNSPGQLMNLPLPPNSYILYAWPYDLYNYDVRLTVGWSNGATDVAYFQANSNQDQAVFPREGTGGADLSLTNLNPAGQVPCKVFEGQAQPGCTSSNYVLLLTVTGTSGGGGGGTPAISVNQTGLNFGTVTVGQLPLPTQTVTISNGGSGSLTVSSLTASAPYSVVSPVVTAGSPLTVPAGGITVTVQFNPGAAATYSGSNYNLTIGSNDQVHPTMTVPLTGTGGNVLFSDDFQRANAAACSLGQADQALGGSGTYYYLPIFGVSSPIGANLVSGALQQNGLNLGGVQVTNASGACGNLGIHGVTFPQNLNIRVDLLVPMTGSNVTDAGPYFGSRAASAGDGILGGTSAGYWVELVSTGEVRVKGLNPFGLIATTGAQAGFNAAVVHTLQMTAQGSNLQVALDGRLLTFGASGTTVTLPANAAGANNQGTVGIAFGDEDNSNQAGGQRATNLVISAYNPGG